MNFNIDNYGGKSIVPLKCGNMSGTAFFISRAQLLTATHLPRNGWNAALPAV